MSDLFAGKITYQDKEACARRELQKRREVYPRLIQAGKLNPDKADREIEVMSAIVDDYTKCVSIERSGRNRLSRGAA
jgi:hypothetical protein